MSATLSGLAFVIENRMSLSLPLAVYAEQHLQAMWDACDDDMAMRLWLSNAGKPGAMWIKCEDICERGLCEACCDAIRKRYPIPPTLAELMAARAR